MTDGMMAQHLEHNIDLSRVTSTGIVDRSLDISELMQALPPVDLQGIDASKVFEAGDPVENPAFIGHVNQVGIGPEGFRDIISDVFEIDSSIPEIFPAASTFICTHGVMGFESSDRSTGAEMTKGYNMQIAVGPDYSELVLLPKNRALAEALHHAAVAHYHQGCTSPQIKEAVEILASRLGVQAI